MEFVAIDFETTGWEHGAGNEPWQLGVAVVRDLEIVKTREFFFGTPMTPDCEPMMSQWDEWSSLLTGHRLVAHNIATERTILTRAAPLTRWGPWTDTLRLAKAMYPTLPGYSLGELCETFGVVPEMEGRTWHDALYDAVACARLAIRLNMSSIAAARGRSVQ
jgi:DNA polymerase III epsilon subunit-like protein